MSEPSCYHNHWEQASGYPPRCLECGEWIFVNAFGQAYVARYAGLAKTEKNKPMAKDFKNGKVIYKAAQ